jgi:CRP-like cAMP-binding protein
MPRSAAPGPVPSSNQLLAALPAREYARLGPHLEPVSLAFKDILYEPDCVLPHVYFPLSGVLSLIIPAEGRPGGIEVGVVGREGMAALPVFLGDGVTPLRCIVQVPGDALRMRAEDFRARVSRDSALHSLLLGYTQTLLNQVSQSVVCNSLHPIEQRLSRWLLTVQDRAESDRFPLTHEFLAAMLGVRRASVTEAARKLRITGLIHYGRGELTVLDRPGLESISCGCHRV